MSCERRPKPFYKAIIAGPEDVKPSSDDMKVIGVFNPGATTTGFADSGETVLSLRVAEAPAEIPDIGFLFSELIEYPVDNPKHNVLLPYFDVQNCENSPFKIRFDCIRTDEVDEITKKHVCLGNDCIRLRHVSHQRFARSPDGKSIGSIDKSPSFYPEWEHEKFGIEDTRITRINDQYLITYVSPHREYGVSTSIAITADFGHIQRLPLDENPKHILTGMKDVAIFPEPFSSDDPDSEYQFGALVRPSDFPCICRPGVWVSFSPDKSLKYWGGDRRIIFTENGEITGTGPPMVMIEDEDGPMWLSFYHIINKKQDEEGGGLVYDEAIFATDYKKPWELKYKSPVVMEHGEFDIGPGFVHDVCYTTGMIRDDGVIRAYSGENDTYTSVRFFYEKDLMRFLKGRKVTAVSVP